MSRATRKNESIAARRRVVPLGRPPETDAAPPPAVCPPAEPITEFRVIRLDQPGAPVIEPAAPPALAVPAPAPEPDAAAPRRAVPLAPPTAKELAAARDIALAAARPRLAANAAAAKARRPAIENKLAAAAGPGEMLRVIDVEVALQRARRLSGTADKQRGICPGAEHPHAFRPDGRGRRHHVVSPNPQPGPCQPEPPAPPGPRLPRSRPAEAVGTARVSPWPTRQHGTG